MKSLQLVLCILTIISIHKTTFADEDSFYEQRPNIVWIFAEDISTELSCYGHPAVDTPCIDGFADEGVRFDAAFTTAPSCSPARAAMATGVYQISIDAHHQRMHRDDGYQLPEPVRVFTHYLQEAGYFTALGCGDGAKTDYNFSPKEEPFDGRDWSQREEGQPFFAQITLNVTHRHKKWEANRAARDEPVAVDDVVLPPYYPDHPICRLDWATYLDQMEIMDAQFGEILQRLEDEGLTDNTLVIFMGDNGRCHVRGKCYLYDPGLLVPLVIRWPDRLEPGSVRDDLVSSIDVTATVLRMAGVALPDHFDGHPILGPEKQSRDCIFAARDRIDEAIERMRCVRTDRFKYIRNDWPQIPYTQPHGYIEANRPMLHVLFEMHERGELNEAQARFMAETKPEEELYDLVADPHELNNLVEDPTYQETLLDLRQRVEIWRDEENDSGRQLETPEGISPDYRARTIARYREWGFDMPEPEPIQRSERQTTVGPPVTPENDASGAVDGYKDGTWGFHTATERNPWWQVDLGSVIGLHRIVVYNRCDNYRAERAYGLIISVSDDGETFTEIYRNDGKPFGGEADQNPLVASMEGRSARFVRLSLEGSHVFHLDEVEIYSEADGENIALGCSANQSSSGPWSAPPK